MARWFLRFASHKRKNDIFDFIKSGEKTIETRPFDPRNKHNYSLIKPGDTLIFYSLDSKEKLKKTATFTHVYPNLAEMVLNEPTEQIFPGIKNPVDLLKIYETLKVKWGKTYAYKLEKYGIVAVGFN